MPMETPHFRTKIMAGDLPGSSKKQSAGVPDVSRIIKVIFKNLPAYPN